MSIRVELRGRQELARFGNGLGALDKRTADLVMVRALKRTGNKARTQVIRALTAQTGLKAKVVRKAVKTIPPNFNSMAYVLASAGGNIGVKFFGPRETEAGVQARPFGKATVFPGTFTKAGFWPKRVNKPNWNGQVFYVPSRTAGASIDPRQGRSALSKMAERFAVAKSGVVIPDEMLSGATLAAFSEVIDRDLATDFARELDFAAGGLFK